MGNWTPKYTREQKRAIEQAWFTERVRPARRIVGLAAIGRLKLDTETLPAFEIPLGSLTSIIQEAKRRQSGILKRELSQLTPQDQVEAFRRRLTHVVDLELEKVERHAKKRDESVSPVQLKQLASALKELAAIPQPKVTQPDGSTVPQSQLAKQLRATMREGKNRTDAPESDIEATQSPQDAVRADPLGQERAATLQALRVAVE